MLTLAAAADQNRTCVGIRSGDVAFPKGQACQHDIAQQAQALEAGVARLPRAAHRRCELRKQSPQKRAVVRGHQMRVLAQGL